MEKLKDILYDVGDTLFALIIVLVMVSIVTIKLTSAMDINILSPELDLALFKGTEDVVEPNVPKPVTPKPEESNNTIIIDDSDAPGGEDSNTPSKVDSSNEPEVIDIARDITLDIPKGSSAASIAKLLVDNNLVDSSSTFLNRVQELKLDPKLRYGSFKLKSNYSLDKIISVITGTDI